MIWGTFNNGEPWLRVSVTLPGITVGSVAIDVVIDTGATHTCVHPFDAMFKLGIDPMLLTTPGLLGPVWKLSGVGGTADYQVHQAHYEFLHEDSRSAVRTNERIYIAVPTPENDTLPSLLGMDLLQHFTLHMDYRNGVLTLDEQATATCRPTYEVEFDSADASGSRGRTGETGGLYVPEQVELLD